MDIVSDEAILKLSSAQPDNVISIYMGTHKTDVSRLHEDQIRYKNLLHAADNQLGALGVDSKSRQQWIARGHNLLQDELFWHHQDQGLVVFISKDRVAAYRLPVAFDDAVVVAKRHYVKPLLPLRQLAKNFYILALSPHSVRLFRATLTEIEQVVSKALPKNITEALGYDDNERSLQNHAGPTRSRANGVIFHGHGGAKDAQDNEMERFIRAVRDGVEFELKNSRAPLVYAGVEEHFAQYKVLSRYKYLLDAHLHGNFDGAPLSELHEKTMPMVAAHLKSDPQQAVGDYRMIAAKSPNRVATDLLDIVDLADQGRVGMLLVSNQPAWGDVDDEAEISVVDKQKPGSFDLLDLVATDTLRTGGQVYFLDRLSMPGRLLAAAILRY